MKIHIVQKGDTLWKIANNYGVDFEELKAANSQLANPEMIMPGMKIKVPSAQNNVQKTKVKKDSMESTPPKKTLPKVEVKPKEEVKSKEEMKPTPKPTIPEKQPEQMMEMPKFEVELKEEKKIQLPKAEKKMLKKEEVFPQPEQMEIPKIEKQPEQMMPTQMLPPEQPIQPIQPHQPVQPIQQQIQYVPVYYYPVQSPCCPSTNCHEMYHQPVQEMHDSYGCDAHYQQLPTYDQNMTQNWVAPSYDMNGMNHNASQHECTCNQWHANQINNENYYPNQSVIQGTHCRENQTTNPIVNQTYAHDLHGNQEPRLHSNFNKVSEE